MYFLKLFNRPAPKTAAKATAVTTTPGNTATTNTVVVQTKERKIDVDKMITHRVDLEYIPGLDDEDLKVILPASFEASLAVNARVEQMLNPKIEKEEEKVEEEEEDAGPKPMLPYSCMFILGPENWLELLFLSPFLYKKS